MELLSGSPPHMVPHMALHGILHGAWHTWVVHGQNGIYPTDVRTYSIQSLNVVVGKLTQVMPAVRSDSEIFYVASVLVVIQLTPPPSRHILTVQTR